MTCNDCNSIKRFFCIVACRDANDAMCAVDESLEAENERYRVIHISAWAMIFFIIAVMASCELSAPIPGAAKWNVNPELKYRANQQIKEAGHAGLR